MMMAAVTRENFIISLLLNRLEVGSPISISVKPGFCPPKTFAFAQLSRRDATTPQWAKGFIQQRIVAPCRVFTNGGLMRKRSGRAAPPGGRDSGWLGFPPARRSGGSQRITAGYTMEVRLRRRMGMPWPPRSVGDDMM
jgi:hypothetical protein